MTRILASATVERLNDGTPPVWEVLVYGGETPALNDAEAEHRRTYTVEARSDSIAAQEGIRLFVDEIEALSDAPMTSGDLLSQSD